VPEDRNGSGLRRFYVIMEKTMSSKIRKAEPLKINTVIRSVKESIGEKSLKPGDRVPPLNQLSRKLGISSAVVYRGLLKLVDAGFLECQGTRGFFVAETPGIPPLPKTSITANRTGRVFLSLGHHSDLTWQHTFGEYDEIRAKQLDTMADRLERYPDLCAYVEQAYIMERYFQMRPEKKEIFRKAHGEGRFTIMGGMLIPDLNMSSGELLIRNLQLGRRVYADLFGEEPDIANLADAFGMPAQIPQILKKAGYRFLSPGRLPGLTLDRNRPFLWTAPDGSSIPVIPCNHAVLHNCFVCNWIVCLDTVETLTATLENVRHSELPDDLLVQYSTEFEDIPEDVFTVIQRMNREHEGRRIEFGSIRNYAARLDCGSLPAFSGELNPIFTGCYTTRCDIKRRFRALENLMFETEMLGAAADVPHDFEPAWRLLMECSFHDALCGCHTDACFRQIAGKFKKIDRLLADARTAFAKKFSGPFVFDPGQGGTTPLEIPAEDAPSSLKNADCQRMEDGSLLAVLDLEPHGVTSVETSKSKAARVSKVSPVFETEFFSVDFRQPAPKIWSKKLRRAIADPAFEFGELLIRSESGSMWTEVFHGPYFGRESADERVTSVVAGPAAFVLTVDGEFRPVGKNGEKIFGGFGSLTFRKEYRFFRKLDWFTLGVTLDFSGVDTKVSLRFPVAGLDVLSAQGVFGIPMGAVVRKPCFEVLKRYESTLKALPQEDYTNAAGDFPAYGWVDYSDYSFGVALANRGVVGHQLVNGRIYASLLRSGTRTADGAMKPEPGVFDNGEHRFEFAIRPHEAADVTSAPLLADRFNHAPRFFGAKRTSDAVPASSRSLFRFDDPGVMTSSCRLVEDGWILRVYETSGRHTVTKLTHPGAKLFSSDLRECDWTEVDPDAVELNPWEIRTLKIAGLPVNKMSKNGCKKK